MSPLLSESTSTFQYCNRDVTLSILFISLSLSLFTFCHQLPLHVISGLCQMKIVRTRVLDVPCDRWPGLAFGSQVCSDQSEMCMEVPLGIKAAPCSQASEEERGLLVSSLSSPGAMDQHRVPADPLTPATNCRRCKLVQAGKGRAPFPAPCTRSTHSHG